MLRNVSADQRATMTEPSESVVTSSLLQASSASDVLHPPPSPKPCPSSSIAHRIFHPPKLERKHSSGDLHSRLKTRKILGVGETDNGDIHRSKISQLLGHNDHLYVKFPRGYWLWHLTLAIVFTTLGLMNLLLPDQWHMTGSRVRVDSSTTMATRFYGSALLGLAMLMWSFWGTTDKGVARGLMSATSLCLLLQMLAMGLRFWPEGEWNRHLLLAGVVRITLTVVNGYFFQAIGSSTAGLRKTFSHKDLRELYSRSPTADSSQNTLPTQSSSPTMLSTPILSCKKTE